MSASKSTGTWQLTVDTTGNAPKRFADLPIQSKDWKTLDWLGWSSTSTERTRWYLDNLDVANLTSEKGDTR